jgi:hypothetical protein
LQGVLKSTPNLELLIVHLGLPYALEKSTIHGYHYYYYRLFEIPVTEILDRIFKLSPWDLTNPLSPHTPTMQMLLESSFFFCTQQVTKRLHSGEAATAGKDGITRTVIRSLRGGRGGRQRVFAASSLDGAARVQYAAMEAGGGAVTAPPKKGQLKDRPAAGRRGRKSVRTFWARFFFFFSFFFFFPPSKGGFTKKGSARS